MLLSGCATKFPTPEDQAFEASTNDSLDGQQVFAQTFKRHGGEQLDQLKNVNVGITGQWKQLIRRIQPLVTDFKYRVDSQERLLPKQRVYAAHYTGPAGNKSVFRTPQEIKASYNSVPSTDANVLSSTALTADSFHLFLLGPLGLSDWQNKFQRLSDKKLKGQTHYRIYLERKPGLGFAESDSVVLWVDQNTKLTSMVQITLLGHESTKAAHVETEFLDYVQRGAYTFPSKFFERVNAPIAIDAHGWELTGIDINRNYQIKDLREPGFSGAAQRPASFD